MRASSPFLRRTALALVAFCLSGLSVFAGETSRDIPFTDLAGKTHTPLRQEQRAATVLFFVLPDCPVSNAYAPEIQRISADYAKRNVSTFLVYVDPDLSAEDAKKHATEYGYTAPVLRDTRRDLVRYTGVTIAPEAAVIGPDGKVRYHGRIDDLYADYGKRRVKATQYDLRNALDAVLAGQPVPRETVPAIGCHIARPE